MKIKREFEVYLPDIEVKDDKQQEYLEELVEEVLKEGGILGLLSALEFYLDY